MEEDGNPSTTIKLGYQKRQKISLTFFDGECNAFRAV